MLTRQGCDVNIDDHWLCHGELRNLSKRFFEVAVSRGESDLQSPLRVASKFLQDQGVRDSQNENPIIDPRHE
ncbi:hypothetical protein PUN28_012470 [Cardiocondyla obscurior]|uniref:Uncharacterized protein n=1 Tax=Cardiocondyla obscurior TaxID=286306 RepID=A0AAW2FBM3_9HYME